MRIVALLTVLALAAPSMGALLCDVACAAHLETAPAVPQDASCHDQAAPQPESPSVTAWHICHEMGLVPASIVRDAASHGAIAPAIVVAVFDSAPDNSPMRTVAATRARLTGHAPPPLALPLRI